MDGLGKEEHGVYPSCHNIFFFPLSCLVSCGINWDFLFQIAFFRKSFSRVNGNKESVTPPFLNSFFLIAILQNEQAHTGT